MRLISWIVTLALAIVAASFAVSNPGSVTLALWPTPFELSAPVYLIVFIPFLLGFVLGGLSSWFAAGRTRGRARDAERSAYAAQREADEAHRDAEAAGRELEETRTQLSDLERQSKALTVSGDTGSKAA